VATVLRMPLPPSTPSRATSSTGSLARANRRDSDEDETMIERIIVGIDQGNLADDAITAGLDMADVLGAEVEFVHGVQLEGPLGGSAASRRWAHVTAQGLERARDLCFERMRPFADHHLLSSDSLEERLVVRPEPGARALLAHAAETRADLILIGSHRHRRLFDFGGTGRTVLAHSTCAVWMQPAPPRPLRRILAPIDLSESSNLILGMAGSVARIFGAEVSVMNCFRPPLFAYDGDTTEPISPHYVIDEARDSEREEFGRFLEQFDWPGAAIDAIETEGEPWTEILSRQGNFDLIVMGTHGRTGFARAVLGSVAYRVLKSAKIPILVVPIPTHAYGAA